MSEMLEFRALGPFEVLRGNDPIELGPHKQRMLLALLLINANRVVSRDRITEALWGQDASDKENALWVYVSRLRTVLEPERSGRGESTLLITKEPGYMLTASPQHVDILRFEQGLDESRALIEADAGSAQGGHFRAGEPQRGGCQLDTRNRHRSRCKTQYSGPDGAGFRF